MNGSTGFGVYSAIAPAGAVVPTAANPAGAETAPAASGVATIRVRSTARVRFMDREPTTAAAGGRSEPAVNGSRSRAVREPLRAARLRGGGAPAAQHQDRDVIAPRRV